MRYVFRCWFALALGLALMAGCSDENGEGGSGGTAGTGGMAGTGGAAGSGVTPGLWIGGSPASNADGNPFDTGWAICFYVNADGTALTPSTECDIDGDDDEAHLLEISWKEDVSDSSTPDPCSGAIGVSTVFLDDAFVDEVPIEESSFFFRAGDEPEYVIDGTFNGNKATGAAKWDIFLGLGGSFCELDGGWTAAPAP
jgi:hypothetical protein